MRRGKIDPSVLTTHLFDLDEARRSYYTNLFPLNPGGIVPAGPSPADLGFPERDLRGQAQRKWQLRRPPAEEPSLPAGV